MWHQKSCAIWIKEGETNTTFFYRSTILHRRTNLIYGIHNSDGVYISDLSTVKKVFLNHFKHRWFHSDNIGLIDYPFVHSEISLSQNDLLIKSMTYNKIEVLKSLYTNKVPGFDRFPPFFFQYFWPIIKSNVYESINYFFCMSQMPQQ